MSKTILVDTIADKFTSKAAAESAVDAVFDGVEKVVRSGEAVQIRGFGSFQAKERKPRVGTNPRTRERITIAGKRMIGFKTRHQL